MYIFEILVKHFKKKPKNKRYIPNNFTPKNNDDDSLNCEHLFMPVDSTGEVLACSKCGLVVSKKNMKKKNIFKI